MRQHCHWNTFTRVVNIALLMIPTFVSMEDAVGDSAGAERVVWQKTPIELGLTTGVERRADFPGPVKIGVPVHLQGMLRIQSIAGSVYLLAHEAFEPTRVMAQRVDNADIYLLDLSASNGGNHKQSVQILVSDQSASARDPAEQEAPTTLRSYGYVTLTRFAAQQLYAPARLLRGLPGVVRVPVRREPVALVRGAQVAAVPMVAWRSGDLYVTAVKLTNQSDQAVILDPRSLRGSWLTATFQHNRLLPSGDEADTTAVYLVSARPFESAL